MSLTPATELLKANRAAFTGHPYEYLAQGGADAWQPQGFD